MLKMYSLPYIRNDFFHKCRESDVRSQVVSAHIVLSQYVIYVWTDIRTLVCPSSTPMRLQNTIQPLSLHALIILKRPRKIVQLVKRLVPEVFRIFGTQGFLRRHVSQGRTKWISQNTYRKERLSHYTSDVPRLVPRRWVLLPQRRRSRMRPFNQRFEDISDGCIVDAPSVDYEFLRMVSA